MRRNIPIGCAENSYVKFCWRLKWHYWLCVCCNKHGIAKWRNGGIAQQSTFLWWFIEWNGYLFMIFFSIINVINAIAVDHNESLRGAAQAATNQMVEMVLIRWPPNKKQLLLPTITTLKLCALFLFIFFVSPSASTIADCCNTSNSYELYSTHTNTLALAHTLTRDYFDSLCRRVLLHHLHRTIESKVLDELQCIPLR